jgi:calcium/calmodulin-dependent protein kinase I
MSADPFAERIARWLRRSKRIERIDSLYSLDTRLGDGAQAEVWRATPAPTEHSSSTSGDDDDDDEEYSSESENELPVQVAIKCIPMIKLSTEKKWERLSREVDILSRIRHPNIMQLYAVYHSATHVYMATELCSGGELFDRLISVGFFPEAECRRIILQVVRGVAYLHARNIAHRDLKPENILMCGDDDDCVVKICDFGYGKVIGLDPMRHSSVGSPGYASPEVFDSQPYSLDVDMFSIGVILYTMLCGFPPFYHDDEDVLLEIAQLAQFEFPSPWWDDISAEAKDAISRMITKTGTPRLSAAQFLGHPWAIAGFSTGNAGLTGSAEAELARRKRFSDSPIDLRESQLALNVVDALRSSASRHRNTSSSHSSYSSSSTSPLNASPAKQRAHVVSKDDGSQGSDSDSAIDSD